MKSRTKLFLLICIIGSVVTLLEINLNSVKNDFFNTKISNNLSTNIAYHYLSIRCKIVKHKQAEYALAVASSMARQPAKSYMQLMQNGGKSIFLLKPIALDEVDEKKPWKTQAAYELLLLLVRMPWDQELTNLSSHLALELKNEINSNAESATANEAFDVKEVLSMYAARMLGKAALLEGMEAIDVSNSEWRLNLAYLRVALAACVQRVTDVPDAATDALRNGLGPTWLKQEAESGWDIALVQTVTFSHTSEDCKNFSRKYQSMIDFLAKE
jgi:hypothetical protein